MNDVKYLKTGCRAIETNQYELAWFLSQKINLKMNNEKN